MILLPFTLLFWVWVYKPFLCFLSREVPLAFVEELVWWCWILWAFAYLYSFWLLLHIWMRSLLGTVIQVVGFSLSSLSISCHSLLAWIVYFERSAVILMGIPVWVICVFPLLLLIIVLCVWSSLIWLICVLDVLPWVYPVWDSPGFLDLGGYFLPHVREVFNYYLLKYFLMAFLFVLFWDSYDLNVGV